VQSKPKPIVNNAGTPIGVSVNKDKSKDGSLLGGIYNTIVGSVARLSGGLGYLETLNPFVQIGKGVKDRVEDISEGKRGGSVIFDARENANPNEWRQSAEQFVEKARSSSSTKEQEQARSEFDITNGVSANDVKGMLFQAPAQVFDMVAGALSGGSSFFI